MNNLKSITKSTYYEEGLEAIRIIKNNDIKTFNNLKDNLNLSLNSASSRKSCWGLIKRRYLKLGNENELVYTPLLKLIDSKSVILNRELIYLSYLNKEKTLYFTIINYLYPKFRINEKNILNRESITGFLSNNLDYSEALLKKTASTIAKALVDFGFARSDSSKKINFSYYEPDLITFLYALYGEYTKNDYFTSKYNILNPSFEHIQNKADFPKLLFMKPNLVEVYLQQAWKQGYLNYEPRGGLNQYVLKYESLDNFADHIIKEVSL